MRFLADQKLIAHFCDSRLCEGSDNTQKSMFYIYGNSFLCFMFYLLQCHQSNNSSGCVLPPRVWHKLDVPQFFVEFTCKSLGYSQRTSLWEQAAVMVRANLGATAILTGSEKLENNKWVALLPCSINFLLLFCFTLFIPRLQLKDHYFVHSF